MCGGTCGRNIPGPFSIKHVEPCMVYIRGACLQAASAPPVCFYVIMVQEISVFQEIFKALCYDRNKRCKQVCLFLCFHRWEGHHDAGAGRALYSAACIQHGRTDRSEGSAPFANGSTGRTVPALPGAASAWDLLLPDPLQRLTGEPFGRKISRKACVSSYSSKYKLISIQRKRQALGSLPSAGVHVCEKGIRKGA